MSRENTFKMAGINALLASILTGTWILLVILSPKPGNLSQIEFLLKNKSWQMITYFNVFLLTITQVPFWLSMFMYTRSKDKFFSWQGLIFGLSYIPFALFTYWSQMTLVRGLADLYHKTSSQYIREMAESQFNVWNFNPQLYSISYSFDVLAYFLFGIAAISFGYILRERAIGWLFTISGICGLAGAAGFVMGLKFMEQGVIISGIVIFFAYLGMAKSFLKVGNDKDNKNILEEEYIYADGRS